VKVDAEQNGDLARELGVRSYPTLFLASASGEILEVQEGFVAASRFLGQLQRALNEADSEEQ
jgi:thioredoxin-related protein